MGDSVSAMFAGAALGILCVVWPQIAVLRKRLARVEGKLDVLLKNADLQYDPFSDIPIDVADAVRSGDKMLAIKLYREATGSNLRDAKELVEDLQRCSGVAPAEDTSGCLAIALIVCAFSVIGGVASVLIWRPDPGSGLGFVASGIGVFAGGFIGLIIGMFVFRSIRKRGSKTA